MQKFKGKGNSHLLVVAAMGVAKCHWYPLISLAVKSETVVTLIDEYGEGWQWHLSKVSKHFVTLTSFHFTAQGQWITLPQMRK